VYIVAEHVEILKRPGLEVEATEHSNTEGPAAETAATTPVPEAVAVSAEEAAVF
jgi:hypothetical protein